MPGREGRMPGRHLRLRRTLRDDLRQDIALPDRVDRIVSLVPSLTEALAVTVPDRLVGATDWCNHPADLDARGCRLRLHRRRGCLRLRRRCCCRPNRRCCIRQSRPAD